MPDPRQIARIMKALSNPHRVSLYLEIAAAQESGFTACDEAGCRVSDIIKRFTLSAPTISHHLKELANADLITTERQGKFLVARINPTALEAIEGLVLVGRGAAG